MGDISKWKNKNRDILTKWQEKFAAPWDKDGAELKALLEGVKKISKNQKKFKKGSK